mmetsp:Transcript_30818/g.49389  ORF Transcript_30818/g.49389 Transcript_30818/m.49389 type:complete len:203 (+) Transcript_30818:4147-4755(+)
MLYGTYGCLPNFVSTMTMFIPTGTRDCNVFDTRFAHRANSLEHITVWFSSCLVNNLTLLGFNILNSSTLVRDMRSPKFKYRRKSEYRESNERLRLNAGIQRSSRSGVSGSTIRRCMCIPYNNSNRSNQMFRYRGSDVNKYFDIPRVLSTYVKSVTTHFVFLCVITVLNKSNSTWPGDSTEGHSQCFTVSYRLSRIENRKSCS